MGKAAQDDRYFNTKESLENREGETSFFIDSFLQLLATLLDSMPFNTKLTRALGIKSKLRYPPPLRRPLHCMNRAY